MAINNTVKLIGNTGSEVKILEKDGKFFAAFSLATTDSYKERETEEWKDKETVWHDIVVFSPTVIEQLKSFKKGARLEVIGSLSYREFETIIEKKPIKKKEASIIANKVEQAPLVKKNQDNK